MTTELLYCGELISEAGLESVVHALEGCSWAIELCTSGYDGTLYLRTLHTQHEIDLEMDSGQSRRFLFEGVVEGTTERAVSLLGEFSRCLAAAEFCHRIEIEDHAHETVGYFHHRWPLGQHEPIGH